MPSWSSPSPEISGPPDAAALAHRFVEASRRAEIIALVNAAGTAEDVAHVTVDELSEALEAEIAYVLCWRPDRGTRETLGQTGLTPAQAAAIGADPLCRTVQGAPRAEVFRGPDLQGLGLRHLALSPWTAADGRQVVIGAGRLYDEPFIPSEVALLEAVTTSVAYGLERSWLAAERDRHAARQAALARAARSFGASLVGDEVLESLASEVAASLAADVVAVHAFGEHGELDLVAGSGLTDEREPARAVQAGELAAQVVADGTPRVRQASASEATLTPPALPGGPAVASAAAAPIRRQDAVEGVVLIGYRGHHWIEREDLDLLAAFADLAGVAWRNASDHAAVQEAAALDSLTGCLNHGAFQDRLREEIARAARGSGTLGFALLDLNEFKAVNDTLGHLVGDALLRGVADALREAVRPYDRVARYGGDEFALLLPATDEDAARRVVDRALAAVAEVRLPEGASASATAGIAHWRPGEAPDELIDRADRSLLEAKRARGRGRRGSAAASDSTPQEPPVHAERDRLRRLATAGSLGTRLARLLDERAIAETAIVELGGALGYERCLLVRCGAGGTPEVVAAATERSLRGPGPATLRALPTPPIGEVIKRCLRERRTVLRARGRFEVSGSHDAQAAAPVYVAGKLWGALAVGSTARVFDDDDAHLVQRVADHLGTALRSAELYEQLDETHLGTAAALAAALEAKDAYTADHARSIADLAVAVGEELGVDESGLRDLRYGAIFHDIGKIAIPDAILNKAGPLTEAERSIVRRHPAVGEQILAPVPFLAGVREIVRHDHERWDGSGYPDGLRGDEIPVGARVVLVVDAYHAMRSDRPYRKALPVDLARAELRRHAGTQFDPRTVDALLTVLEREPGAEPG